MRFLRLFVILFLAAVTSCAAPAQSPASPVAQPALKFIEFYSPL